MRPKNKVQQGNYNDNDNDNDTTLTLYIQSVHMYSIADLDDSEAWLKQ